MKSGSWSSWQAALPSEARAGGEPDYDEYDRTPNGTDLIRLWWSAHRLALEHPGDRTAASQQRDELTAELERRGVVKPGVPMPREGAEDLADEVDDFKRRKGML